MATDNSVGSRQNATYHPTQRFICERERELKDVSTEKIDTG